MLAPRIVLVRPSHPGNIGAVARAMKNMGLTELYLVNPSTEIDDHARARASGADDILQHATITSDLTSALVGCQQVYGTSARSRSLSVKQYSARQCARKIVEDAVAHSQTSAIVFGCERTGLDNRELSLCHYHVYIPTNPEFSSLNLAAAVQVICYEWRVAHLADAADQPLREKGSRTTDEKATADQIEGFYTQLEQVLLVIEFLDPKQSKTLMQRLRRLFNRATLEVTEINILRGILSGIMRRVGK